MGAWNKSRKGSRVSSGVARSSGVQQLKAMPGDNGITVPSAAKKPSARRFPATRQTLFLRVLDPARHQTPLPAKLRPWTNRPRPSHACCAAKRSLDRHPPPITDGRSVGIVLGAAVRFLPGSPERQPRRRPFAIRQPWIEFRRRQIDPC